MNLICDIETDGIEATKIHCIAVRDADTGKSRGFGPSELTDAFRVLRCAKRLIGHNIIGYDLPTIERLTGNVYPGVEVYDTLVLARLCWPDVQQDDWSRVNTGFPRELVGRHSLEAWGHRLDMRKGDYAKTTDWKNFTPEMLHYCVQDTEVTRVLWQAIKGEKPHRRAVEIEHEFARIILRMEQAGFGFDLVKAKELAAILTMRREELRQQLVSVFPPRIVEMKTKTKTIPFNPGSRVDIANGLKALHGWQPKDFTADGRAKIDEAVLSSLPYEEAKTLLEYLMVSKRLGQLAEGREAWMSLVHDDGRIHGRVITNGAVTGRCTHRHPNMAQVPGVRSPYGRECRSLFIPKTGWSLVGADASGLELRCLAHYMAQWDGGAYAREICEGDIHTANQKAAGLETRDQAKLFIYALLYGAGDSKIGGIVGGEAKHGKRLKAQFFKRTPAIKVLRDRVQAAATKGFIIGLDGRRLPVRSAHAALNLLLQSAGAVLMKQATINLAKECEHAGIEWGRHYRLVAHVHDEMQLEADAGLADKVGELAVKSIRKAGIDLEFKCPLDGEFRVGGSWAETH